MNAGEVYVLDDGGEADLDLGNYERYLDVTLGRDNNITTGKVYQHVIEREVRPGSSENQADVCSAAETTSARLFKSFPTSPTLFKTGLREWPRCRSMRPERSPTSASSRSVDSTVTDCG